MDDLTRLADLIREKNVVDNKIADIIGRPAQVGHAGEYIAATIFGVTLHHSAPYKSSDGYFINEPLAGRSVNIKWYLKHENILDLNPENSPDYLLVLTGPRSMGISSRGGVRPWSVESVFLFESHILIDALRLRGIKLGVATSVIRELWDSAEIYPVQRNNMLMLNEEQRKQLALFREGEMQHDVATPFEETQISSHEKCGNPRLCYSLLLILYCYLKRSPSSSIT